MLLPSPSRLVRSLLAAASLFLAASPALAAAPEKGDTTKPAATKKSRAEKKSDKAVGKRDTSGAKAARTGKKSDDKTAKADKKSDAKSKRAKKDDAGKDNGKGPRSIGAPNKGKLSGAIKLRSSRSLKVRSRAQAWALPDLVKLLQRAAGKVAKRHPKSVMLVGDLSRKAGGAMTGHNSHQSGRDADVALYVGNSKGKPVAMTRFVAFDGDGKSEQVTWAQFDDARNWALVEALVTDTVAPVRYIFVSNPLRLRLLAYAKKKKVDKDVYTKAAFTMMSPRDADVHDDHFHVRITCPESMKGTCVEESIARGPAAPAAKSAVAAAKGAKGAGKAKGAGDADSKGAGDADSKAAGDADSKAAAAPAEVATPEVAAAPAKP